MIAVIIHNPGRGDRFVSRDVFRKFVSRVACDVFRKFVSRVACDVFFPVTGGRVNSKHKQHNGFTLVELMIVIVVMAILVTAILPNSSVGLHEQLQSAARVLRHDIAYARSLAVSNGSKYRITFDTANNKYTLTHEGTNPSLDALPDSQFRNPDDPDDEHITKFDELLGLDNVRLLSIVETDDATQSPLTYIEFGPLGGTTASGNTVIWFEGGPNNKHRYISITVNPVTGLTTTGPFTAIK